MSKKTHVERKATLHRWGICFGFLALLLLVSFGLSRRVHSGSFMFAGEANGVDIITHPLGYNGTGGNIIITIGIDPTSANAASMELSVQNIVNTWNGLTSTTGNLLFSGDNNIPDGFIDFESTALHELGHALGLGHPNIATESGASGDDMNYTKSTDGANDSFDLGIGADGVRGSTDDIRGDDVNLNWYEIANNNPFTIESPTIDSATYSRDPANLPGGDSYSANADRTWGAQIGYPDTEAVMQQGAYSDEAQRTLGHDDVATFRLAMAGLDETEATADDYTVMLVYAGLTTDADIVLDFDNSKASFASTTVGGGGLSANHVVITSAAVYFNDGYNWFFNDQTNMPHTLTIVSGPSGNPNPVGSSGAAELNVVASDTHGHDLSYSWTASCPVLGSNGGFSDANVRNPTWTAPENLTGSPQDCTIEVTVDDGQGLSEVGSYSQTVNTSVPILLVDDDNNAPDARAYYSDALDTLGFAYDVWDTNHSDNEPTAGVLSSYAAVIWFTGNAWEADKAGPGDAGESALGSYLDGKGCLFISSMDYYFSKGQVVTPFMNSYLGVSSMSEPGQSEVTGAGSVFGGEGTFALDYTFFDNFSDAILPDASSETAFSGDGGSAAVNKESDTYRTVFFGFPFGGLATAGEREQVMSTILDFCDTSCDSDYSLDLNNDTIGGTASFEACSSIYAHDAFVIDSSGDVTFTADKIVLGNGFSVANDARFVANDGN